MELRLQTYATFFTALALVAIYIRFYLEMYAPLLLFIRYVKSLKVLFPIKTVTSMMND